MQECICEKNIRKIQMEISHQTDRLVCLYNETSNLISMYGKTDYRSFVLLCNLQKNNYFSIREKLSSSIQSLSESTASCQKNLVKSISISIQLATQNIAAIDRTVEVLDSLLHGSEKNKVLNNVNLYLSELSEVKQFDSILKEVRKSGFCKKEEK